MVKEVPPSVWEPLGQYLSSVPSSAPVKPLTPILVAPSEDRLPGPLPPHPGLLGGKGFVMDRKDYWVSCLAHTSGLAPPFIVFNYDSNTKLRAKRRQSKSFLRGRIQLIISPWILTSLTSTYKFQHSPSSIHRCLLILL